MEIIWTKERTRFVKGFRDLNARFTRTAPEKNKLIVVVPLVLNLDLKLNKQVGFDFGMIAGVFSVILAGYLMYEKGWRDEDED